MASEGCDIQHGERQKTKHHLITSVPLVWEAFNSPDLRSSQEVALGIYSAWDRPNYSLLLKRIYSYAKATLL